jgi:hypothetical protein
MGRGIIISLTKRKIHGVGHGNKRYGVGPDDGIIPYSFLPRVDGYWTRKGLERGSTHSSNRQTAVESHTLAPDGLHSRSGSEACGLAIAGSLTKPGLRQLRRAVPAISNGGWAGVCSRCIHIQRVPRTDATHDWVEGKADRPSIVGNPFGIHAHPVSLETRDVAWHHEIERWSLNPPLPLLPSQIASSCR